MLYLLIVLGLVMLANVAYAIKTGVLQVKLKTIDRRQFPRTYWFVSGCFVLIGGYLLWLAYWDYRLL